jgi:hypothetical protein
MENSIGVNDKRTPTESNLDFISFRVRGEGKRLEFLLNGVSRGRGVQHTTMISSKSGSNVTLV